jgi:hypothetical protein
MDCDETRAQKSDRDRLSRVLVERDLAPVCFRSRRLALHRHAVNFDPREIENYLRAADLSPADELRYRLALAGISPRCPNTTRTHELLVGLTEDELADIIRAARTLEAELRGGT